MRGNKGENETSKIQREIGVSKLKLFQYYFWSLFYITIEQNAYVDFPNNFIFSIFYAVE